MPEPINVDIATLQTDIKQLRTDFAKIAGTMRELANNSVTSAEETVTASADKVWSEAKRRAQTVGHEIEERPLASALTAFATGMVVGLFLSGRRNSG